MHKKLIGEQVSLAPVRPEDADKLAEWLNDLDVVVPLGDEAYTSITAEALRKDMESSPGGHVFTIVDNESNSPLGRCLLFQVDQVNRCANLGILIGEKTCWDRGCGREAVRLLLDYAFNLLNLNSVMLGVYEFNQRALACCRSLGFKELGRRRQARLLGGKYYDLVLMDMLASDFSGKLVPGYFQRQSRREFL